jgi:cytochrome P450
MEGLRVNPGIARHMARTVSDKKLVYGNWTIPAGTLVAMTTVLIHTDERLNLRSEALRSEEVNEYGHVKEGADTTYG